MTKAAATDCGTGETASKERKWDALKSFDADWHMTRREAQWERRYRELSDYKRRHGDCCVPVSYGENRKLAHWVSNQRKQWNLRRRNRPSHLTRRREERLDALGFVWNRWEYEFSRKSIKLHL